MSDYSRRKALRVPLEFTAFEQEDSEDVYDDLETWLFERGNKFEIAPTTRWFVDYPIPLKHRYGEGEWGKSRRLTDNEMEKYAEVFATIGVKNMDAVRLVEYCWYDCSEAPDYYDETTDDFYNEV
jgi:hypothetical protein